MTVTVSLLTLLGSSDNASLISIISPSNGAKMSDAAFTLSITTISSSFETVAPSSGSSTKTTSPSCVLACAVMPTTTYLLRFEAIHALL